MALRVLKFTRPGRETVVVENPASCCDDFDEMTVEDAAEKWYGQTDLSGYTIFTSPSNQQIDGSKYLSDLTGEVTILLVPNTKAAR